MLQLFAILVIVAFTLPPFFFTVALIKGAQSDRYAAMGTARLIVQRPSPNTLATSSPLLVRHQPKPVSSRLRL